MDAVYATHCECHPYLWFYLHVDLRLNIDPNYRPCFCYRANRSRFGDWRNRVCSRYGSRFSGGTRRGLCQRQRKVCNDLAILRHLSNQFKRRIGRQRERDVTRERVEPVTARGYQGPGHSQISTDGFRVDLFVCHVREQNVATRSSYFKLVVGPQWLKVRGFYGSTRRTYIHSSTRVFQADVSRKTSYFNRPGSLLDFNIPILRSGVSSGDFGNANVAIACLHQHRSTMRNV